MRVGFTTKTRLNVLFYFTLFYLLDEIYGFLFNFCFIAVSSILFLSFCFQKILSLNDCCFQKKYTLWYILKRDNSKSRNRLIDTMHQSYQKIISLSFIDNTDFLPYMIIIFFLISRDKNKNCVL
ncbi:hypothetical protein BDC45DRAFT_494188 [Circinella umbellata]|nr:hypothetical protein BDC45DRAFT_494188 [Circinella umbellata]